MGDAVASRLLTVAKHLPLDTGGLPATYQYFIARAVKAGKGSAADLLAEAAVMPQLDFLEAHGLLPAQRTEPTLCCPSCGHESPASRFRGGVL
jgi:hypothetical protein